MLTPSAVLLFFAFIHATHQLCHHSATTFYREVSDDLWAMQKLRESVFLALRDSNSHTDSAQSYSAVTVIMDGLRRRTVDLYPILQDVPQMRSQSPKTQMVSILETFSEQRHVGCAAELATKAVKSGKLRIERNLTKGLDFIYSHSRAVCLNEILDIFWSYLCSCPPTQPLVGGMLMNVPVRMSVADTRQEVSNMLKESSFEPDDWQKTLEEVDLRNMTLTQWLAELLYVLANQTDAADRLESLADGIVEIRGRSENEDKSEEEIAFRIHPKELDTAGLFVPPTREGQGIYRLGPTPQLSDHPDHYKAKIPSPRRPKRNVTENIDAIIKKLKKSKRTDPSTTKSV